MDERKAFVFDTNFIIQTKALDEVIANLSDRFSVYVTEVSVEERMAQQCRELKARYDELEKTKEKYGDLAKIILFKTFSERENTLRSLVRKKYEDTFGNHLIPFSKDSAMLSVVFDRANKKLPPFSTDERASDKGFKDTLIWESILAFFKESGEDEVLFITDDSGFTKNAEELCKEFATVTNKALSIHPNSYYRELLKPELVEEPKPQIQLPNVEKLRERIHNTIFFLCDIETIGQWGDEEYEKTFTINKLVDIDYVQKVFDNLGTIVLSHLFETELSASVVMELDDRITDTEYRIPMYALENAVKLYNDIINQYPEYVEQFYSAAVSIINQNYKEPEKSYPEFVELDDDELPF